MKFKVHRILKFSIECEKRWKTSCLIFCANIVPVLVEARIWEARMHIQDRHEVEFIRKADNVPEQAAVGCIRRQRTILVCADKRIREVSEELIIVVEFTLSIRMHVAGKHCGAFVDSPAQHG